MVTLLLDACEKGTLREVQRLVQEDPSRVSAERNANGATALITAAWYGHLEVVQWLVTEAGANPKTERSGNGTTAFLAACTFGHIGVAKWLIGNTNTSCLLDLNNYRDTPFILACANGQLELARWLYAAGLADARQRNVNGADALLTAAWFGQLAVLDWLYSDVSEYEYTSYSVAMRAACRRGHLHVLKWLFATAEGTDDRPTGLLWLACQNGHEDVARWLIERDPSAASARETAFGLTPFLVACEEGHLEIAKCLASVSPALDITNYAGENALTLAFRRNHWAVCEWLMDVHEIQPTSCMDLTSSAHIARVAARIARWRLFRCHWLRAVVACGTDGAAVRADEDGISPPPVLKLLRDARLAACGDGEGRPLRYMSWYGGMVAAML